MYNPKSCNALEKPFYTPLEAALRWCNLIAHEAEILMRVDGDPIPPVSAFPQWPCLRANAEKILDAILNNELPYGRDGKSVQPGEQVRKDRRTVRHHDLKSWMTKHYPDQTPPFLFDEIERTTHAKITTEAWQALQAECDALKRRLEKAEQLYRDRWSKLEAEYDSLQKKYEKATADSDLDPRERATFERLLYVLAWEAGYKMEKPSADEGLIQKYAASIGAKVPTGKGPIAGKLAAATARFAQDQDE